MLLQPLGALLLVTLNDLESFRIRLGLFSLALEDAVAPDIVTEPAICFLLAGHVLRSILHKLTVAISGLVEGTVVVRRELKRVGTKPEVAGDWREGIEILRLTTC